MATAIACCINAVVKVATESEFIGFLFYPGAIRVLSGFHPGVSDQRTNHIISDSVQIMATAFAWCISAVVKDATESEIIRFFFIRVLSGFYPGVSDRPKNRIISDSVQIMATAFAWCISAVVKVATESEIIRFFFYPGPIRVLSGSLGSTEKSYNFRFSSNNGNCNRVVHKCSS